MTDLHAEYVYGFCYYSVMVLVKYFVMHHCARECIIAAIPTCLPLTTEMQLQEKEERERANNKHRDKDTVINLLFLS